ncbi:uncharacterized protein LOC113302769 [Papaver somniferum]|uniref:uncharacterized protein LOC113302769 n=1 Tax=Papaver somniferum TaxID=3469 RepID=UPI000E701243|nr:uncharacterized protein LOC113302769 [Papaver somniferum]
MGFLKIFSKSNRFYNPKTKIKAYPFHYISNRRYRDVTINERAEILPVLIVGAGPVGLVLSILLTKLGVKCAVIEKSSSFSQHPQAHFINNRTMEVFRKLDGLAEEIERLQPPVDLWRKFIYCTSLYGSMLGSVDHMQPQDFKRVVSPVSVAHFSQYKLTKLLLKQLEKLNFCVCTSDELEGPNRGWIGERNILLGYECASITATDDGIVVGAKFLKDGVMTVRNIRCGILVGSDGAGSTVRKLMGVAMKGETDLQKLVSVHFMSRDLGNYLLGERPGMLFFIFNTEAIGVLVAHDLDQGEFVLQLPFYPPQQTFEDFNAKVCEELITKLVGRKLVDINVIGIKPWVMHAEVAEKFVSSNNQIILAGDAAHRFPPAGGFGMNTGIQDAHNLAWKIAAIVKGVSPSSLLQTYEMERKPVAVSNTALSIQNFRAAMKVPAALGIDPAVANSVQRIISSGFGSILPTGLQKAILDGIFMVGRKQLSESLLNENNPLGSLRLGKLRRIFEEGDSLQLQFPAEDLGFRYLAGALVPEDGDTVLEAPTGRRRDYVPCAEPGARLPHMNIRRLLKDSSEETLSTLDLVSEDKLEFLLIISPKKKSCDLARAAFKVSEGFDVSLKVCVMWPHGSLVNRLNRSNETLTPWSNYIDVEEVSMSSTSSWWDTCQMTNDGAILVRPDEHIAWRKTTVILDPISEMESVFSQVLGIQRTKL